jgi:hypothetical protein
MSMTRDNVSNVIKQELSANLAPFLGEIEAKVLSVLETQPQPSSIKRVTTDKSIPDRDRNLGRDRDRENDHLARIEHLEMKVQITASEKEAQDEMIVNANNEKMLLNQKLRMAEKKSKKLESILLQAGLAPTGLDDDKVYKGFETLRFGILQLVKQICTNRNASIKDNIYSKLSDEAKDYYVMAIVAQALYKHCFSQEKIYFGFDATADGMLAQFYSNVSNHSKVSQQDMADWRVRTCLLAQSWDDTGHYLRIKAKDVAENIVWKKLNPFMPSARLGMLDKNVLQKDAKEKLVGICEQALRLALMFNSSKIEYAWTQDGGVELDPSRVQPVGSLGFKNMQECGEGAYMVVFGGVVKGGGVQGKLAEEPTHLSDTLVIFGPFGEE